MRTAEDYIDGVLHHMPRATPLRAQIALELRGHIAERVANGQSLDDVVTQLGDPSALAESYLSAVPLVSAPFWRRAAAKILDVVTLIVADLIVVVPWVWLLWHSRYPEVLVWVPILALIATNVLFLVYTVVAESQWGQTLGKYLLGVRAVRESGARVSVGQAIVRHLPVFLQVFAIDAFFALFTEKNQRAFELLSKTRVVLVSPPEGEKS
jgi:uncharacterized RDD family membrane protein YckC